MKLTLDKKHANRIIVVANGMHSTMANLIRRYGMSRVPVLAIDGVTFYDNTSAFWDEYISHRLGLLPLITPENTPAETEVTFSLDAEGPKIVHSSDLVSSDKEITVAQGKIPLVTLGQNQHIRFECKAIMGTAVTHAKFQAGLLSYGVENESIRLVTESFFQMKPEDFVARTCDIILADVERVEAALGKKAEKKEKPVKKAKKKKEE